MENHTAPVSMNEQQKHEASQMWLDGQGTRAIGAKFGLTETVMTKIAAANRHLFPSRTSRIGNRWFAVFRDGHYVQKRDRPDTMLWTTEAGAIVTLPKISLIQCPRRQGALREAAI